MNHIYETSQDCQNDHCDDAACWVCVGNLSICKVCGLIEGSLTTDCPGRPSYDMADEVYNGSKDFVDGKWITGMSKYCPHHYGDINR